MLLDAIIQPKEVIFGVLEDFVITNFLKHREGRGVISGLNTIKTAESKS